MKHIMIIKKYLFKFAVGQIYNQHLYTFYIYTVMYGMVMEVRHVWMLL